MAWVRAPAIIVMPGLVPGIHVLRHVDQRRGWPGQARPWRCRGVVSPNDGHACI